MTIAEMNEYADLLDRLKAMIPDVTAPAMTLNEVLTTIERRLAAGKDKIKTAYEYDVEIKTLTERLGTSYAREIELTRDLTEVKIRLQTAGKESADLARALHLAEDKINAQAKSVDTFKAERETMIRFFDDMRTVVEERNATPKYIVDAVAEMVETLNAITKALGLTKIVTLNEVLTKIATQIKDLDRVRDAIGLRESAPMDYVVQRICDTRRDMLWAQGTVKEVSRVLFGDAHEERGTILRKITDMAKDRDQALGRFATLSNGLCDDLDMPTGDMDAVRRRVRDLVVFEQDAIKTMGGPDRDQVRDGIGVLQSEYKAQTDTFTILRQILGLGVGCALTTIVAKVQYLIDMDQFHGSAGSLPALRELVLTLHTTKTMDANEAMTAAADKIKDMRQGLLDLLNNS